MKTAILRHRRENLKKCSLKGLENHPALDFYTYPTDSLPNLSGYILLKVGAPQLCIEDQGKGLLLIDGTWKLATIMEKQLKFKTAERSLPTCFQTAYPRKQTGCPNASQGLASVEALYLAHHILKLPTENLLDSYHWKDLFIEKNQSCDLFEKFSETSSKKKT